MALPILKLKFPTVIHKNMADEQNCKVGLLITQNIPPPPWRKRFLVGQGLLIMQTSPSHSDTPHSVALLWTSDKPDAKTYTWQHTCSQETDIHAPGGIRIHNSSKRVVANPWLRRHGHGYQRNWH